MKIHLSFLCLVTAMATLLGGCAPNQVATKKAVNETTRSKERTFREANFSIPFDGYLPMVIPGDRRPEPISLKEVVLNFPANQVVGRLEGGFFLGMGCRIDDDKDLMWKDWAIDVDRRDFMETFFDAMQEMGYSVIGDPTDLFLKAEDFDQVVYDIGALVTGLHLDLCMEGDWWDGDYTGKSKGSGRIRVDWQVYSNRAERRVYRIRTRGNVALRELTSNGIRKLILGSFREAVRGLGESEGFLETVSLRRVGQPTASPLGVVEEGPWEPMALPKSKLLDQPFRNQSEELLQATVSIALSDGHGSGFFVSKDGYLLTSHHVVRNAKQVKVRLSSGLEIIGSVVRTNRDRDIALIKVPISQTRFLPARLRPLDVGEEVYAIGSPVSMELSGSVTKGVVSAHRIDETSGLPTIQADVDVHGGNSGGPLVDRFGNVVGVTVSGVVTEGSGDYSTGLNFFIPIGSAFEHLGIVLPLDPSS